MPCEQRSQGSLVSVVTRL